MTVVILLTTAVNKQHHHHPHPPPHHQSNHSKLDYVTPFHRSLHRMFIPYQCSICDTSHRSHSILLSCSTNAWACATAHPWTRFGVDTTFLLRIQNTSMIANAVPQWNERPVQHFAHTPIVCVSALCVVLTYQNNTVDDHHHNTTSRRFHHRCFAKDTTTTRLFKHWNHVVDSHQWKKRV